MPEETRKRVTCHHCGRPAMWGFPVGENGGIFPLCLDCGIKYQDSNRRDVEEKMRLMNHYLTEFEMVSGVQQPRFQLPQRALVNYEGLTLHNINVSNSNIGVLNSGTIGSIDSAVGVLQAEGGDEIARALTALTEAVIEADDIEKGRKDEVLETLNLLASQATLPMDRRAASPMRLLVTDLATWVSGMSSLSQVWEQYGQTIVAFFQR